MAIFSTGQARSKDPRAPCVHRHASVPKSLLFSQIYSGLTFKISIHFPANYPYVPPAIKFDTPCFHPNVDITGGSICLDILQVRQLKCERCAMLTMPNRTNGLPYTVSRLYCCPSNHSLEVSATRALLAHLHHRSSFRTQQCIAVELGSGVLVEQAR